MLTQICQYLKNWFDKKPDGTDYPKYQGEFVISGGNINIEGLVDGQYVRIIGSLLNDGVHKIGDADLKDETFTGYIWSLGIPQAFIDADEWATVWLEKNGSADSAANSPFNSESFGGYSYSKSSGASGSTGGGLFGQPQFAEMLAPWRKI